MLDASNDRPFHRLSDTAGLDCLIDAWRQGSETVALVPTMGALHEGHLQLVDFAKSLANRVVVSIFVNPAQFGPQEDFARYPRQNDTDCALLAARGADAAWLPSVPAIYPEGFASRVTVGPLAENLCGASRPGHFDGVATVVTILLNTVRPEISVFGEKDFQQLAILRRLHLDLRLPGRIVGAPIVREADGLAMSSRNRYLSAAERAIAPALHRCLLQAAAELKAGGMLSAVSAQATQALEQQGFRVDYFEARDAMTLLLLEGYAPGGRLFVAAHIGETRLIDNVEMDGAR